MAAESPPVQSVAAMHAVAGELVVVRATDEALLPRRQGGRATEKLWCAATVLAACGDDQLLDTRGIGLPANEARIVGYLEDCEARKLKPATVGRRLASLAVVHGLLGVASPTRGSIVRDALRGFRRRVDVTQRQAGPLRFGEGLGSAPAKGFTLSALLQACPGTLPGLRDGALLSLAYDTGLRVSELVRVACDHITVERDGSAVLTVPRSKTDQEGLHVI